MTPDPIPVQALSMLECRSCGAGAPPRIALRMMYRNSSCDRQKPKAPIELILFQVSKISG